MSRDLHFESNHPSPLLTSNKFGLTITLQKPSTPSNFLEYNKLCEALDSDYLMQPINEAEYDSETQACIDRNTGGPTSFYDHYVSKATKKKGMKIGCECPVNHPQTNLDYLTVPGEPDLPLMGVSRDVLRDPVARRLATGRLPPPHHKTS